MAILHISDETLALLTDVAKATGRDAETLAAEAVAAYVADEAAFVAAVEEGKAAVARGEVLSDEELADDMEAFMASRERQH